VTDYFDLKQQAKLKDLQRQLNEARERAKRQGDLRALRAAEEGMLDGTIAPQEFQLWKKGFEDHIALRDSFRPEDV
jgi:hypothetical protein